MFHKIGTAQDEDVIIYENPEKPRWSWGLTSVVEEAQRLSFSRLARALTKEIGSMFSFKPCISLLFLLVDELIGAYSFIG